MLPFRGGVNLKDYQRGSGIYGGDKTAPFPVITSAANPEVYALFSCSVTFYNGIGGGAEDVFNFVALDINVTNGTLSNFAGSGSTYTFDITPTALGTVTIAIGAGVCTDAAGNLNLAAVDLTRYYNSLLIDLRLYYKLDEAAGVRVDSVEASNLSGSGTVGQTAGKIGNAVSFATGYLTRTTLIGGALDLTAGFTIWGWINMSVVAAQQGIGQDSASINFGLDHDNTNSWKFRVVDSGSGTSVATNTTASATDTWFFVCGRYNPSTKKAEIRVNGSAWSLGAALTNGPKTPDNSFQIGRYGAVQASNTVVDEVGVSERYLSNAEVDALYNGGTGVTHPF